MTDAGDDHQDEHSHDDEERSVFDRAFDEPDTGEEDDRSVRSDRRLLRWILVVLVVVAGGLYVAGYAFAGDRLPRGATVAGVDVGGLRPARAQQVLSTALRDQVDDPVVVVAEGKQLSLDPEEVGLDVDVPASVAQVPVGRSWDVSDMWETFVGGGDYDPVVVLVDDLLEQRLTDFADEVDRPAVEGGVDFTRKGAEPTYPEPGVVLDVPAAVEAVRAAFPADGDPVGLPMTPDQPEVSAGQVSKAMKRFADPAMSSSVTYRFGDERVVLRPARFAPALSMRVEDGRLVPEVDRERLLKAFRPAMRTVAAKPRDATVRIVDGRPQVIPAKKGVRLDEDRVVDSFLDLVVAEGADRQVTLATSTKAPRFTTADARALGITEQVSEFTTYYPYAEYRNINIGRAAELIDGTLLRPGDTFSLNDTVGERTRENGFTEGFVISDGVFKEDLGGGVSQVATTTFNAAFFAGLEDVEHKPHSFYIDRYPVGREATVAWPTVDLRFRNDTDHGVLIQTVHRLATPSSQGSLTVRMWSTPTWDITAVTGDRYAPTAPETRYLTGDDCVPNQGYGGFQIDVTRVFRRVGSSEVDHREVMHTTYTPSDTVVCS